MAHQKRFQFGARSSTLFNRKTVERAFTRSVFQPTPEQERVAREWAEQARHPKFRKAKETAVRGEFIQKILVTLLGYAPYRAGHEFTLATEEVLGKGSVDTAIGKFSDDSRFILGPFELKGPGTADLDAIMPGRHKSPVQQAWEYATDAPGAKWVLVSNCSEIRLYAFGCGRDLYEYWDLSRIDDPEEHWRLWLFLGAANLLSGKTGALLVESAGEEKDITAKLYGDYKITRDVLIHAFQEAPGELRPLEAIEHAQTILDRVLFIAFAEDTALLPPKLIQQAWERKSPFRPNGAWENFAGLFEAVDRGNPALDVPAYNGGLFAKSEIIDALRLSNFVCEHFAKLADYDFQTDVSVTVLGHIFEQSVSDVEAMRAKALGQEPPKTDKRKRDGVVYTPDFITRFIVEQTVAKSLAERFADVLTSHGVTESEEGGVYPWDDVIERSVWLEYQKALRSLTIVDPACGSGAFLIAAFDYLSGEYRRVSGRLGELGVETEGEDVDREILAGNLHGVDLNPEPVEITKLSLWLKTAKRGKLLQDLHANIKCGNSLITDAAYTDRPFDWTANFPRIAELGGFDIVLGNPPYVRMEILKPVKPYLEERYEVTADRADLYAYFFEKGLGLLKPGGRLGYISSSTFMRTRAGTTLRSYLIRKSLLESVVDFGDIQVFEGVTTYPIVMTMRRPKPGDATELGTLSFLNVKRRESEDLSRTFRTEKTDMPQARLTDASWQFEQDELAALRAKLAEGRSTLAGVFGEPLYGIKTGLNEAFVVSREQSTALIEADPRSAELLKPFLRGEDIRRWQVEDQGFSLINIPIGALDIADYPAIRDHLLPFRVKLEARATRQAWYELQQSQLAYQEHMAAPKVIWPQILKQPEFCLDEQGFFPVNKAYFFKSGDPALVGFLNSKVSWFYFASVSVPKNGGYREATAQHIGIIPSPDQGDEWRQIRIHSEDCAAAAKSLSMVKRAVRRRIPDLCPPGRTPKLSNSLHDWWKLDFKEFSAEVSKAFKTDGIPLRQRNEWEDMLRTETGKVEKLSVSIRHFESKIDKLVYSCFKLTGAEVELLERTLREGET